MDRFLPSRIEKCPLIDALIEFRFEAAIAKSAVFGVCLLYTSDAADE